MPRWGRPRAQRYATLFEQCWCNTHTHTHKTLLTNYKHFHAAPNIPGAGSARIAVPPDTIKKHVVGAAYRFGPCIRDLLRQCMLADALDALGGTSKLFPPNALAVSLRKVVLVQTCYRCNFATCGHVPLLTCASAQLAY